MSEDIPSGPARTGFTPNLVVGIGVTLLGVLLTLDKLQVTNALAWLPYWPVLLVLFGSSIAYQAFRGNQADKAPPIVSAPLVIMLIFLGVLASRLSERTSQCRHGARWRQHRHRARADERQPARRHPRSVPARRGHDGDGRVPARFAPDHHPSRRGSRCRHRDGDGLDDCLRPGRVGRELRRGACHGRCQGRAQSTRLGVVGRTMTTRTALEGVAGRKMPRRHRRCPRRSFNLQRPRRRVRRPASCCAVSS